MRVILCGAAAAAVTAAVLAAEPEPEPLKPPPDPPPDQTYRMVNAIRNIKKVLDGPVGQAECIDVIKGHDVDFAGNWYWAESAYPAIRMYDRKSGKVRTIAGSTACGLLDGPLESARFGGWSYNATNLISVSGDGKHIFVQDTKQPTGYAGPWRHVDREKGIVESVGPYQDRKRMALVIVRDKSGTIYAFCTTGQEAPDCSGYTKLKIAPLKTKNHYIGRPDDWALDVEKMKFYYHGRGNITVCDLKTGDVSTLAAGSKKKPAPAGKPFAGTRFWCPTGMSLSPSGRYLYVGGGDYYSCHRFDLETKEAANLEPAGKGVYRFFKADPARDIKQCPITWPGPAVVAPDGELIWPGSSATGMYRLVPVSAAEGE
jgi:hypothetical protein